MAKSYESLIDEARELLQDSLEPHRWTDAYLLNTLNRGLQELARIRPDAYYSQYDRNSLNVLTVVDSDTPDDDEVDWGDDFPIDMMFFTPLVAYVVGSVELTEDEFSVDGRAVALLTQFRNSVIGI